MLCHNTFTITLTENILYYKFLLCEGQDSYLLNLVIGKFIEGQSSEGQSSEGQSSEIFINSM